MELTDTQLAFLKMAMDSLEDTTDHCYSSDARIQEIKNKVEAELDRRSTLLQ